MKTIMLRGLDEKPEITRTLSEYMSRPEVAISSVSKGIESLIEDYARSQRENHEYRQGAELELEALRDKVASLTWALSVEKNKRKSFTRAFKDMLSDS